MIVPLSRVLRNFPIRVKESDKVPYLFFSRFSFTDNTRTFFKTEKEVMNPRAGGKKIV
jgi:hypothetical protein